MSGLFVCRDSIVKEMTASMTLIQQQAVRVEWTKVFKASFMLLFIAYPGAVQYHVTSLLSCIDRASCVWLTQTR